MLRRAILMSRDGTVCPDRGDLFDASSVRLLPGAAEAIRRSNQAGFQTVLVTNQTGVARGRFPEECVGEVNERLRELLADAGARLDGIYYCPHHPEAAPEKYRRDCACRKPAPGLILQAAGALGLDAGALRRSWIIGDSDEDVRAGQAVGLRTVLVEEPRSAHRRGGDVHPDHHARDVLEAARIVAAALSASEPGEEAA